jgi:hypothetical protein
MGQVKTPADCNALEIHHKITAFIPIDFLSILAYTHVKENHHARQTKNPKEKICILHARAGR